MTYAADHGNERLRGTTVAYRVVVKEVRQKLMPELNDAFAERVKPGETLLGLRGAIRTDLRRQDEEAARRELEEQLVDALLAVNDIPVPPSLTEQYLEAGLKDQRTQNERHGRPNGAEEDARYRELTRPLAERIIRTIFLLDAVRRQEGLAVTEAEVDARIEEIAREYGFELEKYRAYADQGPEREADRAHARGAAGLRLPGLARRGHRVAGGGSGGGLTSNGNGSCQGRAWCGKT